MKYIVLLILILVYSCSPIFIEEEKLTNLWAGKHFSELIDKIGEYDRSIESLQKDGSVILIWEASKYYPVIPIELLGAKIDKKDTSISSLHVYVDQDGYIMKFKKSLY